MPIMTPMVREAIALLALPNPEVAALVRERLATNPWLEEDHVLPFSWGIPASCDITVTKFSGHYAVFLNEEGLPRLKISGTLSGAPTKIDARFHNEAVWLIKGLARRREILQAVAETVVQLQAEFFAKGPAFLKPLTLRLVAEQVKLHPSTVSRVTANKTLFVEHGHYAGQMLALRTLFTTRPRTEAVERAVAALIEEEATAGARPLSDERIAALLHDRGYRIARRTVAKHRATLGIGHAYQRRRS